MFKLRVFKFEDSKNFPICQIINFTKFLALLHMHDNNYVGDNVDSTIMIMHQISVVKFKESLYSNIMAKNIK